MKPDLTSIVGVFSFGENRKFVFIHDATVKEMHTDQAVSVFGMVSLWVESQTSMSFLVEMLMITPIEMTSWMLMYALMPEQQMTLWSYTMRAHPGLASWTLNLSRKKFSSCSGQLDHLTLILSSMFGVR
ncbi:hypothetical protein TNCV_4825321 [Trichonephila clavipes]|uniref:Uncharacterized protein n=1 Tax=Trichonephila clavipes TaxID=2585209 RepID=A0A8X6RUW7_TRICX|nr:hypothetical protein TNCV_4825321 [Trichonephila clavipes]